MSSDRVELPDYQLHSIQILSLTFFYSRSKIPPKVPAKPPSTPARSKPVLTTSKDREPVQVFCRIRPLEFPNEDSCVTILNEVTAQVVPPESSQGYRSGTTKVIF